MRRKYTDCSLECIQEGQIPHEAMINLCDTAQTIIEVQSTQNLIYSIEDHQIRIVKIPEALDGLTLICAHLRRWGWWRQNADVDAPGE